MSLGDRVRNVLHGSESDPDHIHPPGSFPTDDMTPTSENTSTAGHQRNKLHKSNDPRGKGHGHSDSGVGLESSSNEPAITKEPVQEAYAPAEGYEERREHAKRSGVAEFDDVKADQRDTTDYNVDPKELGTTVGTTTGATVNTTEDDSQSRNTVRTGINPSTIDHKDPYWGDLPQGQGVYNTVSGHGSTSDETRRQHGASDSQGQGGVYNTVAGHGSSSDDARRLRTDEHGSDHRTFPLVTDRSRQHHEDTTAEKYEPRKTQETNDSHWKEGASGAVVTGVAGAAAYKATRDDEERSKPTDKEESVEDKEKKGHGGLFGVFHRSHRDEKDKEKDHHHKEKHSKDDKATPIAAAGYAARDDNRQEEQRHQGQTTFDNNRSTKTDPALAAAAVAYSQHSNDRNTTATHHNDPATRGNEGEYNTLSSGTTSGIRTGDNTATSARDAAALRETDNHKDSSHNAAMYGTAGAAAALGAGGFATHEYRKGHDDKIEPLNKDTQNKSAGAGGWFTSPVTNTSQTTNPVQTQRETYTTDDSSKRVGEFAAAPVPNSTFNSESVADDPSKRTVGFAAAPVPTSTYNSDPAANTSHSSAGVGFSESTVRQPSAELPRVTDEANHGQYNTLASGTPSGINVGGDQPKATSALPTVEDEDSNKGAMATAGLAAAGAGAGAAGLASRREDNKEKELQKTDKEPLKTDNHVSSVVPDSVGSQQKVTHKCVKCGEENDISQYFKEKGRSAI